MDLALCVGAGEYQHFPALSSPHRDSLALAKQLDAVGDFRRIFILSDLAPDGNPNQVRLLPVHKNIVDTLIMLARSAPPNGGILVYLGGYAEMKDGQAHFLPTDAVSGKGIPISEIIGILDSGKAARKFIFVDAANPDPAGTPPAGDIPASSDTVVVYSHEGDQRQVLETITGQSLFSRALEELLLELDGEVTLTCGDIVSRINRYMSDYCLDNSIMDGQSAVMRGSDGDLAVLKTRPRSAEKRSAILSISGTARTDVRQAGESAIALRSSPAPAAGSAIILRPSPAPAAGSASSASARARAEINRERAEAFFRNKEYDRAFPLFSQAANQGDSASENYLGDMHFEGWGEENDFAKARDCYRRAADQGYAPAQDSLGFMLEHGVDGAADPVEAAKWYEKASEQDYPLATYHLARLYAAGNGVGQSDSRKERLLNALRDRDIEKLLRDDADQGRTRSQYELGLLYEEGLVVEKDLRRAADCFRKLTEHDRATKGTELALGDTFYSSKNYEAAIEWYKKSIHPVFAFGGGK